MTKRLSNISKGLFAAIFLFISFSCDREPEYYEDGEVILIRAARKPEGIKVVFLGDGYMYEDLTIGGTFERTMHTLAGHFCSIEPTKTLKDYYTFYAVAALPYSGSPTMGHTVFDLTNDETGLPRFRTEACVRYAEKAVGKNFRNTVIILVAREMQLRDITLRESDLYHSSNTISTCSLNEYTRNILLHEAVGHGLGKLADEYVEFDEPLPEGYAEYYDNAYEEYGYGGNIDFTDDPGAVKWKHFIGREGYENVGVFEGGARYRTGVWRPEESSIMSNSSVYHFNAPSRERIFKRTVETAGEVYRLEDFLVYDRVNTASPPNYIPVFSVEEMLRYHAPQPGINPYIQ